MFTYYKKGWNIQISPRNVYGWIATGIWVLILLPFAFLVEWLVDGADLMMTIVSYVGFFVLLALWLVAMFFWMKARSEIIDLDAIAAQQKKNSARRRNAP